MKFEAVCRALLSTAGAIAVTACGGGGASGVNFASTPTLTTPSPTPTPTPTPTPAPPIPAAHLGLVSAEPFAVLAVTDTYKTDPLNRGTRQVSGPSPADVKFSYDASSNSYQISIP